MSSTTSLVAAQVRLSQWAAQIRDCTNRPADMKVSDWCQMHGITKANYYYRMKRVRQACLDAASADHPEFAELTIPETIKAETLGSAVPDQRPSAVLHSGSVSANVYENTSEDFLARLIRAMNHAE